MQCTIDPDGRFLPNDWRDYMIEYLMENHTPELIKILNDSNESKAKHHSVAVNALDLMYQNSSLAGLLLLKPGDLQDSMDDAIRECQQRLMEQGSENIDFMALPKASVHLRLHHLPCCRELCKPTVTSIRATDINRLLSVSGTVIRTGIVKMVHQRREYACIKCRHRFFVEVDIEQRNSMPLPSECPSDGMAARPCTGTKFEPVPASEVCRDYQEIRIQEQVHRLTVGAIPRSITLILQDDLVDRCKPGDDVTVVGMLRKRWRPLARDQRPDVELAITAEHVRVRNEERGADTISREIAAEFADLWERHARAPLEARDWLLQQTCPSLSGMYLVKLATLLTLIGGVGHTDHSGMKVRGESHMLLVGDAGVGKSQVLRYAAKLSPRSVLTTGIGSTAAGLTCTAVRDTSGEWMLEAGALVLADGGLCCVDEFDSIKNDERTAVLEAMEQQTISVAKAGMVCKLRTKCTVLAATNPKSGKMDKGVALHSQTGLATPLISRFDIVLLLTDSQDDDRDKRLAAHILGGVAGASESAGDPAGRDHHGVPSSQSPASAPAAAREAWPLEKLRKYLEYVKAKFQPSMSMPAQKLLTEYYSLQRGADDRDSSRSTIRMLEALVRLAQAHARLMFRQEVQLMDAVHAILLMESAQNSANIVGADFSVLKSEFPDDPTAEYKEFETHLLGVMGLDRDGNRMGGHSGRGGFGDGGQLGVGRWDALGQFADDAQPVANDAKRTRIGPMDEFCNLYTANRHI